MAPFDLSNDRQVIDRVTAWETEQSKGTAAFLPSLPDANGEIRRIEVEPDWDQSTLLPLENGSRLLVAPLEGVEDTQWLRRLISEIDQDGTIVDGYYLNLMAMSPPPGLSDQELVKMWHTNRSFSTGSMLVLVMDIQYRPLQTANFVDGVEMGNTRVVPGNRVRPPGQ